MATSKYLNIELDGKQLKDTKDAIENAFKSVETDINTTNNTISNNKIDIETKLQDHKDSITAHNSDDLLNNSTVEGSKISDALNTLKNKDAELDTRIDNIVAQAGTDNTEIVDARTSTTKNKTFTVLKDRFEELEEETKSLLQPDYSEELEQTSSVFTVGTGKNNLGQDIDVSSSVVNGQISDVKIGGRTYSNIKQYPKCDDLNTFYTIYQGFGVVENEGLKLTIDTGYINLSARVDVNEMNENKHYLISAYVKNVDASDGIKIRFYNGSNSITTSFYNGTTYKRVGVIVLPEHFESVKYFYVDIKSDSAGHSGYIKNIMINEITQDEANNLTVDELLEKYTFIDGTKSTLCATRLKSRNSNFIDYSNIVVGARYGFGDFQPQYIDSYSIDGNVLTVDTNTYGFRGIGFKFRVPKEEFTVGFTDIDLGSANYRQAINYYDCNNNYISSYATSTTNPYITDTPPTNAYYAIYVVTSSIEGDSFSIKEIRGNIGNTLNEYIEHQSDESYIHATDENGNIIKLNSLLNGVKDEIKVVTGEKIQRISNDKTLPTNGWTYRGKTSDGLYQIISRDLGYADIIANEATNQPTNVFTFSDKSFKTYSISSLTQIQSVISLTGRTIAKFNGRAIFYIAVPLADYGQAETNAGADAYVLANLSNHTLNYQLAEPVITEIEGLEKLYAYENGTIYIEPVVKFTEKPTIGTITIPNTDIPIQSIESVKKIIINTDGTRNYEEVTGYTNDTTTITGLDDNYFYEVIYEYPSELSTIPTLNCKYPLNISATVQDTLNMTSALQKQVNELNDFTVAMLLNHEQRLILGGM